MLTIEYDGDADGWKDPEIRPYAPLQLDPSASVLHYGLECFEGMKAYKDKKGKVRLFRPDMNMNRFYKSSTRLCLPVSRLYRDLNQTFGSTLITVVI